MKLPKLIRIGAVNYRIRVVDDLHYHDAEWKKHSLNAQILYSEAVIKVDGALSNSLLYPALLHEAVHGMLHQAGHEEQNEAQVIALGYALVAFVRDNPEFIKSILGEDAPVKKRKKKKGKKAA